MTWSTTLPDETSPTPDPTAPQTAHPPDPSLRTAAAQKKTAGLKQAPSPSTPKPGAPPAAPRKGISYADAGVDITSADRSKQRIKMLARFDIHAFPDGVMLLTGALTPGERLYQRSDAVALALELLGRSWRLVGRVLKLLPRALRDWGYGVIARFRYRIFGRYDTCPVPAPEQRSRLLGVYE